MLFQLFIIHYYYYYDYLQIQAVASCSKDPVAVVSGELIRSNQMPSYCEYQMGMLNSDQLLQVAKVRRNSGKCVLVLVNHLS